MNTEHSATILPSGTQPDMQDAETRNALRQRLVHLFRRCDLAGDDGAKMLFQALLDYRLEALQ